MPKLLTIACGLLLPAAVPARADSTVDMQFFGKDQGGVVWLAQLQAAGWAYLRP